MARGRKAGGLHEGEGGRGRERWRKLEAEWIETEGRDLRGESEQLSLQVRQ